MTAPLRTAAQFLGESGFEVAPRSDSFPEYPDLNAQLEALRKLDRTAPEIPWVEYALGKAREARLASDPTTEKRELAVARNAIEQSFKRRTPEEQWPKLLLVIAIIGLLGLLVWMERRRRKRLRRRNEPPHLEHDDVEEDDEDAEDEDDA